MVVCYHLLLKNFWPYVITFKNVCVINVAMIMLLRNSGSYKIMLINMCAVTVAILLLLRHFDLVG
jgi:hypothetical protein